MRKYRCKHCGADLVYNLGYFDSVYTYWDDDFMLTTYDSEGVLRYICSNCEHTVRRDYAEKVRDYIEEHQRELADGE